MNEIIYSSHDQTLWDLAIMAHGSVEGVFSLVAVNGIDSMDHVPIPGKTINVDTSLVFKNSFENRKIAEQKPANYDAIAQHDQSIWDIAIQEYGAIDHVFALVRDNRLLNSLDVVPLPGDKLSIRNEFEGDYAAMNYFRNKRQVATGGVQTQGGIGYMRIGGNFKVS